MVEICISEAYAVAKLGGGDKHLDHDHCNLLNWLHRGIYLPKEFKELAYVIMEVDESQDLQEAEDPEELIM